MPAFQNHDIVVLGASVGGVEALFELLSGLTTDLPAALLVVVHTQPAAPSLLPELLTRRGPFRATYGVHGEPVEQGRIYVAPPDNHLAVRTGHLEVLRGPRENGHRPSVDVLFRSAAVTYGPRVIGVVLSGFLDCGTAGLMSIQARGGITMVQDPADASAPDMPRSAMDHVKVNHVARARDLAHLLDWLVREPVPEAPATISREVMKLEGEEAGTPSDFVCPLCQGRLTETKIGRFHLYRCHVGHAFSEESVIAQQAESLERAMWAAVRALDESASLARRVARSTQGEARARLLEKEESQARQAEIIRRMLLQGSQISSADAGTSKK